MLATGSTSSMSLVDPANAAVSVSRQLELLHIPRSSYHYKPKGRKRAIEGADCERAMRLIDEIHLEMPYEGSAFNSREHESLLASHGVRQSMDGKARWVDNVIIERWFRSLKTEKLRMSEYETPVELRREIADYVGRYNDVRPHQSLGNDRPSEWYHSGLMAA